MFNRQKLKKIEKPSDQKFEDKVNPTKTIYWSFPKNRKRGFNILLGKSTKNYRVQTKVIENSDEKIG